MSVVPNSRLGKITFYEQRLADWATNALAIGTTAPEVSALQTKVEAARDAWNAQQAARNASRNATIDLTVALEAMVDAGADIIKQVRAKAAISGDSVYALASLPVPATPSPLPPPGTPFAFAAVLKPNGSLELTWRCDNLPRSQGVLYHVWRRETEDAEWQFIAGVGEKKIVDTTVPGGLARVYYQVQAVRTTGAGDFAQFTVNFGTTSGGAMTASVAAPKLAA